MSEVAERIVFDDCGGTLSIEKMSPDDSHCGTWWIIRCNGVPDRYVRLLPGTRVEQLVRTYAFFDGECVSAFDVQHVVGGTPLPLTLPSFDTELLGVRGVPQDRENAGICWYASMCFVLSFHPHMRRLIKSHIVDVETRACFERVLHCPKMARAFREYLYDKYTLGDNPEQPGALDGQNGGRQLCELLKHLAVPIIRYAGQEGIIHDGATAISNDGSAVLIVHAFRQKWRPAFRYRYTRGDVRRTFRLVGVMIGNEYCGHQVCASNDGNLRRWAYADADAATHGICPVMFDMGSVTDETAASFKMRFLDTFDRALPLSRMGGYGMCNMNLSNRHDKAMEQLHRSGELMDEALTGRTNFDYVYLSNTEEPARPTEI